LERPVDEGRAFVGRLAELPDIDGNPALEPEKATDNAADVIGRVGSQTEVTDRFDVFEKVLDSLVAA
jgi:hypothetical protein